MKREKRPPVLTSPGKIGFFVSLMLVFVSITVSYMFFITFELGDNASYDEGEATPQDMFYSRAYNYGDDYELADIDSDGIGDYFDALEKSDAHSAEAAVLENPGGTFMYAIWNQWMEDDSGHVWNADATMRRLYFDAVVDPDPPSGGGGQGKKGGGRPGSTSLDLRSPDR